MALKANATLQFTEYRVKDGEIGLVFVCADPGPAEVSEYTVTVSDSELAGVTTMQQFQTLVLTKLKRKYRATGIATKLDSLIGQEVSI